MISESQRLFSPPLAAQHSADNDDEEHEDDQEQQQQRPANYGSTATSPTSIIRGLNQISKPVGLSWHNLTVVHPKSGRVILGNRERLNKFERMLQNFLDNVSGMAEPGQLVALMGARYVKKSQILLPNLQ